MNIISELNAIEKFTIGIGVAAGLAVVPVVSIFVLPIFALKAIPSWIEHRSRYKETLDENGSRGKFGRTRDQDYTRWNGRVCDPKPVSEESASLELMLKSIGIYNHGHPDGNFTANINCKDDNCTKKNHNIGFGFTNQEDVNWLTREYSRREAKDLLDYDLKMVRICCIALIPVLGALLVLFSGEFSKGQYNWDRCCLCCRGVRFGDEGNYWSWECAIKFHQEVAGLK